MYDMLLLALRAIQASQGRRVVIVLSDGLDVHSCLSMKQVGRVARRGIEHPQLGAGDAVVGDEQDEIAERDVAPRIRTGRAAAR